MATAFNDTERDAIREALQDAAWRHACGEGMRKTTVDDLAAEAGISKGAFYRFYDSKEALFLEVLDRFHRHVRQVAVTAMAENAALPVRDQARLALREALRAMMIRPAARFLLEEGPLLMRRLPPEAARLHYQADSELILGVITGCGITLRTSLETANAIIRLLFCSLITAEMVGPHYDDALAALVDSACAQLIAE